MTTNAKKESKAVRTIPSTDVEINNIFCILKDLDKIVKSSSLQLITSELEFRKTRKGNYVADYTFFYKKDNTETNATACNYSFEDDGLCINRLKENTKIKVTEILNR